MVGVAETPSCPLVHNQTSVAVLLKGRSFIFSFTSFLQLSFSWPAMIPPKMIAILRLLMIISLSSSRLIVAEDADAMRSPSVDRDILSDLNGRNETPYWWTEDEMKLYMQGVEDNTTVVTVSVNVYYTLDVGEQSGGKIAEIVHTALEESNKRLEELGALTKLKLHCIEQMTWSEEEINANYDNVEGALNLWASRGGGSTQTPHSADTVIYVPIKNRCGGAYLGFGLAYTYPRFAAAMISWIRLSCMAAFAVVHEIGHNLGVDHEEMEDEAYYGRVYKEFRFALAAVGDESKTCRKQEADWEFRSRCFKSFGKYIGDELENEINTPAENAKACQDHCAATKGCHFFSFKEIGSEVGCGIYQGWYGKDCATCHNDHEECGSDCEWKDYTGNVSVTKSGRQCQVTVKKLFNENFRFPPFLKSQNFL